MNSLRIFLATLSFIFGVTGIVVVCKVFLGFKKLQNRSHKHDRKIIIIGWCGVILLFISGAIIIYFYSLLPVSKRILEENEKEKNKTELPDISKNSKPEEHFFIADQI